MPNTTCVYIDDSGTRNPDHDLKTDGWRDWFGLGGLFLQEPDEDFCRSRHEQFCQSWNISAPLHSEEIRHCKGNFRWLWSLSVDDYNRFMCDLTRLLVSLPVMGHACVIDRPGYNSRYSHYEDLKWKLCKTAFTILTERTVKLSLRRNCKLRVFVEAGDPTADHHIRNYYREMKECGLPFDENTSLKYEPLKSSDFKENLYDLKFKNKSSAMMQLADLYLYPICRGRYENNYLPFTIFLKNKKLVDNQISPEDVETLGIKYSCFELVDAALGSH